MALLTGEARTASAVAAKETSLYMIERETFDRLVAEHPAVSSYFIRLLSERLASTNERLQASKESRAQWLASELEALPDWAPTSCCGAHPAARLRLYGRARGARPPDVADGHRLGRSCCSSASRSASRRPRTGSTSSKR